MERLWFKKKKKKKTNGKHQTHLNMDPALSNYGIHGYRTQ